MKNKSREQKGTGKMKCANKKGLFFLVLEIKKGLWTSQFIVQYLEDC